MLNKVQLIGYLGQNPEINYTKAGTIVARLSLATSETWKDKQSGVKKTATEWHSVILFSRTAEVARDYLQKGSLIFIEGQIKTRRWQDQNGQDRYTTEVIVKPGGTLLMLKGSKGKENDPPAAHPDSDNYDDIPF